MKKYSFYLFLLLISQIANSQEISEIKITKLRKVIDLQTLEKDEFNPILENQTVEQFGFDAELEKIKAEKFKIKMENLRTNNFLPQPKATNKIQPVRGRNFKGLDRGNTPHDNGTSVGNEGFVMHTNNSLLKITDLDGKETTSNSLKRFFDVSSTPVDPRVVYDPYEEKWVAAAIPIPFRAIYLAFSQTGDPNGKWNTYTLRINGGGGSGAYDYPYIGVTENELIITGWALGNGCYAIQVDKFDGYNGKDLKTREHKVDGSKNTAVVNTGRPDAKFGDKAYLLSSSGSGGSTIELFTITGKLSGNPKMEKTSIKVDSYSAAGNAPQKGGRALDALNCRVMASIYTQGKIHFTLSSDYKNSGFNSIMYGIIDVDSKTAKTHFFHKPKTDLAFPSVASFTSGEDGENVSIFYLEVSSEKYPGCSAIVCDENGNWSKPILIKEGLGPITMGGGRNRWGDYTASGRKHNAKKPTVWASGEYGEPSRRASWITEITTEDATGIEVNDNQKVDVKIYPNPTPYEVFNVEFNLDKDENIKIGVYDSNGKFIESLYDHQALRGKNKLMFNKKALSSGIYFLRIEGESSIIEQKKIIIE